MRLLQFVGGSLFLWRVPNVDLWHHYICVWTICVIYGDTGNVMNSLQVNYPPGCFFPWGAWTCAEIPIKGSGSLGAAIGWRLICCLVSQIYVWRVAAIYGSKVIIRPILSKIFDMIYRNVKLSVKTCTWFYLLSAESHTGFLWNAVKIKFLFIYIFLLTLTGCWLH